MSDYDFSTSSLRGNLLEDLSAFLKKEGFRRDEYTLEGILTLINLISDYHEEGRPLYPEVVVTNDMDLFKTMPSHIVTIKDNDSLSAASFKNALKLCAPLATDRWVIFIEIKENNLRFGVLSTEMTETSLSLYRQTRYSDMFPEHSTFAYIRSLGQKIVEIRGINNGLHVYLNLDPDKELKENEIERLSRCIVSDLEESDQDKHSLYFEKLIDESIKVGHGNLIGVVKDDPEEIHQVESELSDGIYLEDVLDISGHIGRAEKERTNESSVRLTSHSSLVKSMLNHDGITLFTTKGRLIGYHLFIRHKHEEQNVVGGARSRAFESMKSLSLKAGLYKSQDGNIKYYERQ